MKLTVYDNGGETVDRYTVVCPDGSVYGMSSDPTGVNGFNQYGGEIEEFKEGLSHTGVETHPIPDCVLCGLKSRGYSLSTLVRWTTDSDKEYFETTQKQEVL